VIASEKSLGGQSQILTHVDRIGVPPPVERRPRMTSPR
jgi:hypothetical protein